MKRRTFISLMGMMAAAGVLSMTGCSSKDTAASTASSATLNKLDSIQKSGKLVVALESLAPCFLLRTGCVPARTAPVWVPLEDRVQLALLLAKGYAALDSRPYGGSLALALYPLKETE